MLCNFCKNNELFPNVEQPSLILEQSMFSKSQFVETRVENNLKRRPSSQGCIIVTVSYSLAFERDPCKQILINEISFLSVCMTTLCLPLSCPRIKPGPALT